MYLFVDYVKTTNKSLVSYKGRLFMLEINFFGMFKTLNPVIVLVPFNHFFFQE